MAKPKPKPKPKPAPKASLDTRIRTDPALRARVLANPGLRSKLSVASLQQYAPAQAKARALTARLNAPITPGSSVTERDLAKEAQAQQTVRYAPQESAIGQQLGVAQQTERDTGSFYDQYRAALQQHQQNVAMYQAGAQQALQNTQAGITGLGQQAAVQMQQQANAGAAQQGVTQAGDLTQLANQALSQRQQLAGTFGAQQAATGAAANTYADTLANVVAPGQKITALAQARGRTRDVQQKLTDLKTEEGAFNQQYRDTRRQDEFKNVLAQQTLGVKAASDAASAAANTPAAKAATTYATEFSKQAAKYGKTPHQWALLGPKGRAALIGKSKKTQVQPGSDVITSGPLAGKTKRWVAAHPDEAGKLVTDYENKKGTKKPKAPVEPSTQARRDFRQKYGVDPLGTPAHNKARSQIAEIGQWLGRIGGNLGKAGQVLTTGQGAGKNSDGSKRPAIPKFDPVLVRAAMDIKQYGGILPGTADRLHHEGYSVAALRLKMGRKPAPYTPPTGAAGKIPGIGGN